MLTYSDEAHLLEKETLEEFRFLLNSEFDSASPLSLVLVGTDGIMGKAENATLYCDHTAD